MVIPNEFGLCLQLISIAHLHQHWCVDLTKDFEQRLVAQVSELIDVSDVVARGEQDAPKAVPQTPPAFEDGLARSCYFFALHVEELYCVFDELGRLSCFLQHIHAEEIVRGCVDCVCLCCFLS